MKYISGTITTILCLALPTLLYYVGNDNCAKTNTPIAHVTIAVALTILWSLSVLEKARHIRHLGWLRGLFTDHDID